MSSDINKSSVSESEHTVDPLLNQPHNTNKTLNVDKNDNNILGDKRKELLEKHTSPFLYSKFSSFSEQNSGANNHFISPTYPYSQQQNYNSFNGLGFQEIPTSATNPYNQSFLMPKPINSGKNNINTQQKNLLNYSTSLQDNDRTSNPLYFGMGNIYNISFLTGSSNHSPMDVQNPLMNNRILAPNTSTSIGNSLTNNKPNILLSPAMISLKDPLSEEKKSELDHFKEFKTNSDAVDLQKTNKKVEKKKNLKNSSNKRESFKRKSISASGAIKPQLLEINNSRFYNNILPVSGIFNNFEGQVFPSQEVNTVDMLKTQQDFSQLFSMESNKHSFNENPNIVDLNNNMLKYRGSPTMYNFVASPFVTNNKTNEYDQQFFDYNAAADKNSSKDIADKFVEHKNNQKFDLNDFKVDYQEAFINASQKYNDAGFNTDNIHQGATNNLGSLSEHELEHRFDMNFINYLVLKEKTNEMQFNEHNQNKVTKKSLPAKKKNVNTDANFYLNLETLNKAEDNDPDLYVNKNKQGKRGRKPKPIKIIDKLNSNMISKKAEINTRNDIAPQYLNSDILNENKNKVFSESTRKVIDEIKQNALNGVGSKLVTFSPLMEFGDYASHFNNSGTTLPMSLTSAKQFSNSSPYNINGLPKSNQNGEDDMYGVLNTGRQLMNLKKVSPFESINKTSSSSDASTFKTSLKSYVHDITKTSANSDKSLNIKAALKNTEKAIKGNSSKPKLKLINSTSLNFFKNDNENELKTSGSKMGSSIIDDIMKDSFNHTDLKNKEELASNDIIKAQFLDLKNENNNKLIENFTLLNENEELNNDDKGNIVKIVKKDKNQQKQNFTLKKMLRNANSNIKQNNLDVEPVESTKNTTNHDQNIIQSLEKMFSDKPAKKKPMKKAQYINISTQVLKSSGNLLVKTSVIDRPQEEAKPNNDKDINKTSEIARKNLNMNWLKNSNNNIIKLAHKSIVESLKNDKNFSDETLTKNKKGLFSCLHCELKFSTILHYAKHLDDVGVSGPYKCPFSDCCWKYLGMKTTQKLRRHCALQHINELNDEMKSILNIKSDSYPEMDCLSEYCNKTFIRKDSILRHQQMVHSNINSRFNKKLEKVQSFINVHYKQLKEDEKKILVKQYMKGALNLPTSYKIKKPDN